MSEIRRRVAEHYSAQAESFAAYWAPILRSMSGALLADLPLAKAQRMVEVGCGTGGLIPDLSAAAPRATVLGVDLSEGMLAVARREVRAPLAAAAAEQLPLRSDAFDVVVFAFVLHRLPRPVEALREAARVLRPGSAVGLVTWGMGARAGLAERIWRDELESLRLPPESRAPAFHDGIDSPAKVEHLLREAGFDEARAWPRWFERRSEPEEWLTFQVERADRARLAHLSPAQRAELARRVRERVQALPPEEFTYRSEAVFGIGLTYGATGRD